MTHEEKIKRSIQRWIVFFMIALAVSGLTAIPVEKELEFLSKCFAPTTLIGAYLDKVYIAVVDTGRKYPFLAYGNDWLAFAHVVLAILFIGVFRDPVRNKWIIEFGIIACWLVIPFALAAGYFRGIPLWWRLIDCSFGILGLIPLSIVKKLVTVIEARKNKETVALA